jgi:hypothetical protein
MARKEHLDLGAIARTMIDSNFYMTLGTADENGWPWVSPCTTRPRGTPSSTGSPPLRLPTRATS